ncbi:MAG: hypothetical protein ABW104_04200 [Candidatus Thiodiazotropha sp. 6PLUC2]
MAINNLYSSMSSTAANNHDTSDGSWFEAMADAWGKALDNQATKIETLSTEIGDEGQEMPSQITRLTAESLKMTFLSNSSHTALSSLGSSLETMARKQ